jgi:hypothetical protein
MDTLEHQPQGQGKVRCSDVGPKTCDWQVSGNSEKVGDIALSVQDFGGLY